MMRRILTLGLLLLVVAHRQANAAPPELSVKKTQIVNSRNEPVRLAASTRPAWNGRATARGTFSKR